MPELVFEVVQESDGGYCAECLTESIFTEADTWDELRKNCWRLPLGSFSMGRGLTEFAFTLFATRSCRSHEATSGRLRRASR